LAFGVAIEAQSLDGPPPVPASQAPPQHIVVNVRFRDAKEVAAVLVQQASTLGLSAEERAQLEGQARTGDLGSTEMQALVLKNFIVEADVRIDGPGEVTVNYLFTFLDTSKDLEPGQTAGPALPPRPAATRQP